MMKLDRNFNCLIVVPKLSYQSGDEFFLSLLFFFFLLFKYHKIY